MKKIIATLMALIVITSSISVAGTKTLRLKDIMSNPRMQNVETAKVGPYNGQVGIFPSSQSGVYVGLIWITRENVTWANLEKELSKEFDGISMKNLDEGVLYKNFEISRHSSTESKNGKMIEVKGVYISKVPTATTITPKYILENTNKLDYLEDLGAKEPFGKIRHVTYLDHMVDIVTVEKNVNDFRVNYTFSRFEEFDISLNELWSKLNLPGEPKENQIVIKDGLKYLFYESNMRNVVLSVAKKNSTTFDKDVINDINVNNTEFGWSSDGLIYKEDEMTFRLNKEIDFENCKIAITDVPGIIKGSPSETRIKLFNNVSPQTFWNILKTKYEISGDKYPTKYVHIGEYEVKFDKNTFYIRKYLHPVYVTPWYLVISSINDPYNPEQMIRKGNMLIVESFNLNGYDCRIEVVPASKNKKESVATYYINTTDSTATVWNAFVKHFGYEKSEMIGSPTSKNFKLRVTGVDGTYVYTKLYKKTATQVILKSSR